MKDNVLLARTAISAPSQAGFFLTLFSYLTHYLPLLKIKIPLTFRGCDLVLEHLDIIPVLLKRVGMKKGQTTCHRIKGGFHNRALQKLAVLLCVRMLVCVFMCTCHTLGGIVRGQLCGLILSFCLYMDSGVWTGIPGLRGNHLYLLSHLSCCRLTI